jgi:hypothetical protein
LKSSGENLFPLRGQAKKLYSVCPFEAKRGIPVRDSAAEARTLDPYLNGEVPHEEFDSTACYLQRRFSAICADR